MIARWRLIYILTVHGVCVVCAGNPLAMTSRAMGSSSWIVPFATGRSIGSAASTMKQTNAVGATGPRRATMAVGRGPRRATGGTGPRIATTTAAGGCGPRSVTRIAVGGSGPRRATMAVGRGPGRATVGIGPGRATTTAAEGAGPGRATTTAAGGRGPRRSRHWDGSARQRQGRRRDGGTWGLGGEGAEPKEAQAKYAWRRPDLDARGGCLYQCGPPDHW